MLASTAASAGDAVASAQHRARRRHRDGQIFRRRPCDNLFVGQLQMAISPKGLLDGHQDLRGCAVIGDSHFRRGPPEGHLARLHQCGGETLNRIYDPMDEEFEHGDVELGGFGLAQRTGRQLNALVAGKVQHISCGPDARSETPPVVHRGVDAEPQVIQRSRRLRRPANASLLEQPRAQRLQGQQSHNDNEEHASEHRARSGVGIRPRCSIFKNNEP
mmetsp:Transcript_57633/g.166887  ORF Transcript_57633/g.166887 Transcript_57633/m.166887 type:complete len:217 (-) Transcript_57633:1-651(-)